MGQMDPSAWKKMGAHVTREARLDFMRTHQTATLLQSHSGDTLRGRDRRK